MNRKLEYALVTGASRGLGKSLALELARLSYPLILVSLPEENLESLSQEIAQSFGVEVIFRETDLTETKNILNLTEWINQNFSLKILVNNAGLGGGSRFIESEWYYIDKMIALNVKATSLLTHQLAPNLIQRESFILNVASLAALTPMPFKTVYPASKAFVHSFTLSMKAEFSGTNLSFSVVHPGPMRTNGDISARIDGQTLRVKLMVLPTEVIARTSIRLMLKKRTVIKLNTFHRFVYFLASSVPSFLKMPVIRETTKREA